MAEKTDRAKWIGAGAASVSAIAAAVGLYHQTHPSTAYVAPRQACLVADSATVERFGLQAGQVDTLFPNACTWHVKDDGVYRQYVILNLSIRSDLSFPDSQFTTALSFGRALEAGQSGSPDCIVYWPLGHRLLASVEATTEGAGQPCFAAEAWAAAVAPDLPADTLQ